MEGEKKRCLECGQDIQYYRKGKIFCDDRCRSRYHNHGKNQVRHYHTKVNGIIERNYEILKGLYEKGITRVDLGDMVQWGFNPEFMTGFRKKGVHMECRCYEMKYIITQNTIYDISTALPISIK